jgi:hypothetical protein
MMLCSPQMHKIMAIYCILGKKKWNFGLPWGSFIK